MQVNVDHFNDDPANLRSPFANSIEAIQTVDDARLSARWRGMSKEERAEYADDFEIFMAHEKTDDDDEGEIPEEPEIKIRVNEKPPYEGPQRAPWWGEGNDDE